MIILSAHRDKVIPEYKFTYKGGKFVGLLDNIIGELVSIGILENPCIQELEKEGTIQYYFNTGEEFGMLINPPQLTDKDLVIVVDVCSGEQYKDVDVAFENTSNVKEFDKLVENLQWEGYKISSKSYTGEVDDWDEAFSWVELNIPVFSFIIPIDAPDDNWHGNEGEISIERFNIAKNILTRTISYLI